MFGFPLLLIPLAIFNIIVFLMPEVTFTAGLFAVPLLSGAAWAVTLSDLLIAIGLGLLLGEIIKAGRAGGRHLTDHLLSFLVLAAAAAEFAWLAPFGNSTFFLLGALAFVDFVSGVALRRRRTRAAPAEPLPANPRAPSSPPPPPVEPRPVPDSPPAPDLPPSSPTINRAPSGDPSAEPPRPSS